MNSPKLLYDVTFDDYIALPGEHFSSIKEMHRSPAHYRSRVRPEDSDALRVGRALHAMNLDPASTRIVVYPGKVRAGKEWLAFQDKYRGDLIVTAGQERDLRAMCKSISQHRHAARLLRYGKSEVTAQFEVDGVLFKARLDFVCQDDSLIELKSTRDNHPRQFEREFARRLYHAQVALYQMALHECGAKCREVYCIAICKTAPFEVVVYRISQETIETGMRWVRDWVARLKECERSRVWPGIDNGNIIDLRIPDWAISEGLPDIDGGFDE